MISKRGTQIDNITRIFAYESRTYETSLNEENLRVRFRAARQQHRGQRERIIKLKQREKKRDFNEPLRLRHNKTLLCHENA